MPAVLEQVKTAAYASVGVNLLVTDAVVGHEVTAPEFIEVHTSLARKHATEALTELRARTEEPATKFAGRFPEPVADVMTSSRTKAWDFIGIDAPKATKTAKTTKTEKADKA